MIDLLVKYAQDKALVAEPGFVRKSAKWGISLSSKGTPPTVLMIGSTNGKVIDERPFARCPDLSQPELKTLGGKGAHFLLASCDVVALYMADSASESDKATAKAKHAFFVDLLRQASTVMPELAIGVQALESETSLLIIQKQLREQKAKPSDKITLFINNVFPIESEEWYDWWRKFRQTLGGKRQMGNANPSGGMVSFATGELVTPAKTHPKLSGLADVGGIGMGSPLIGFDKDAFESYGLQQSANAAMSEESASAYRAALDHLLTNHCVRMAGTKVVHWYSHTIPLEDDPFDFIPDPSHEQAEETALERARNLLKRFQSGERDNTDLAQSYYYALTLSGASGRVMVRDWMVGQFSDLVESAAQWFGDLQIINYRGRNMAKEPSMERVITCLLPSKPKEQKYDDWIKPVISIRPQLWAAAIQKQPIPYGAVGRIMTQHLRFVQTGKLEQAEEKKKRGEQNNVGIAVSLLQTRMALLKAYHCRNRKDIHMDSKLNPEYPVHPAYHYGRLVAVYARLQRTALRKVGAGVVQRFYAAASATPGLVLSRLDRTAQYHLSAIQSKNLRDAYEAMLIGIWNQINIMPPSQEAKLHPLSQTGVVPVFGIQRTLNLEEQTLFALGYYHQLPEVQKMEAPFFARKGQGNTDGVDEEEDTTHDDDIEEDYANE